MAVTREAVIGVLQETGLEGGGTLISRDLVRALNIDDGAVRFVIEAATPTEAQALAGDQAKVEAALRALPGVTSVQVVMTAHGPAAKAPPALGSGVKIGQHPTPHQGGPARISGIDRIIAVGSGKGGGSGCWTPIYTAPASRA